MNREKFKISILCLSSYDEKYLTYLEDLNVSVYHIERSGTYDYKFFIKFIKLIKNIDIDIIHAHSGCIFNSAVCSFLSGRVNFVYTEHGLPIFDNGLPMNTSLKTRLEDKIAAKLSSRIFAVSEEIKEDMLNRFPNSFEKVRIVTNGVDTDVFCPNKNRESKQRIKLRHCIRPDKKIVGSVGRLVSIKNYETLIKAFAVLIKDLGIDAQLMLIGDGVERFKLEAQAQGLGISSRVVFAGVQYNIESILQSFDVFVLPSWTEGTSISLLEAQSCGIPSVVSNVGGNPFIVQDGSNGFLFDPGDSATLAMKLSQILSDGPLMRSMGETARAMVESNYSIKNMVVEYEREYFNLVV